MAVGGKILAYLQQQ